MTAPATAPAFRHEALLYDGDAEFVAGVSSFVREGVEAGEPVLVVVDRRKADLLRGALGGAAEAVQFADMAQVGSNPALIIPAWRHFVDEHGGRGRHLRGVGEPVWPERTPTELAECDRHEALLNLAFAGTGPWWLLCPYDAGGLPPEALETARRCHPVVARGGTAAPSTGYRDPFLSLVDPPLPPHPEEATNLRFDVRSLPLLRRLVSDEATAAGVERDRVADLLLAVNEVATNSLSRQGAEATLRIWREPGSLVCQVTDGDRVEDPLADRVPPGSGSSGRPGLWVANHLCDLVQLRSGPAGTVVRLHVRTGATG